MKQNWTYKKLGEVCDIICGQDYKAVQDDNGRYPIYGTGGIMGYSSQYRCPANCIIIGRKGNINNPLFVEEPFGMSTRPLAFVQTKTSLIQDSFSISAKTMILQSTMFLLQFQVFEGPI